VREGLSSHYDNRPATFQHTGSWVISDGAKEQDASWGCVGVVLLVVLLAVPDTSRDDGKAGLKRPPFGRLAI
jgi:hypothetical protein